MLAARAIMTSCALLVASACGPSAGGWPSPSPSPGPRRLTRAEIEAIPSSFPTTLRPPSNVLHQALAAELARDNIVERLGGLISKLIDLRQVRIPILVEECGKAGAYYLTRSEEIHICYELLARANRDAGKLGGTFDAETRSVLIFATLHEIAHALIDLINVEVDPTREEDLADQFAILTVTHMNDVELASRLVHAPAAFFDRVHELYERSTSDEHSPGDLRALSARCLLYARMRVSFDGLDAAQAARCEAHARRSIDTWNRLLAPYTRLEDGTHF